MAIFSHIGKNLVGKIFKPFSKFLIAYIGNQQQIFLFVQENEEQISLTLKGVIEMTIAQVNEGRAKRALLP